MNENLRENLKRLMRLHGKLNLSELARETQIPQPTLHHIVSGSTKNPRRIQLEKLADYFSVSIKELLGVEPLTSMLPQKLQEELNLNMIPVITWEDLRCWNHTSQNKMQRRYVVANDKTSKNAFAIELQRSLHPVQLFPKGCVVIFDPEKEPNDRDFVLVYFKELDRVILVQMQIRKGHTYLKRFDDAGYADKLIPLRKYHSDQVMATVVESRIRFPESSEVTH
jgi:transcriptional regulator with XRE-family HTH domain